MDIIISRRGWTWTRNVSLLICICIRITNMVIMFCFIVFFLTFSIIGDVTTDTKKWDSPVCIIWNAQFWRDFISWLRAVDDNVKHMSVKMFVTFLSHFYNAQRYRSNPLFMSKEYYVKPGYNDTDEHPMNIQRTLKAKPLEMALTDRRKLASLELIAISKWSLEDAVRPFLG